MKECFKMCFPLSNMDCYQIQAKPFWVRFSYPSEECDCSDFEEYSHITKHMTEEYEKMI